MPCHRSDAPSIAAVSLPAFAAPRAEGLSGAPHGIPLVALGAAASGSDRSPFGGQAHHHSLGRLGSVKFCAHTLKQPNASGLSDNTFSGQAYAEPSRFEQRLACASIVAVVLGVPIALAGGWPLTLLLGGAS